MLMIHVLAVLDCNLIEHPIMEFVDITKYVGCLE